LEGSTQHGHFAKALRPRPLLSLEFVGDLPIYVAAESHNVTYCNAGLYLSAGRVTLLSRQ
jgi:hypothetical protein